MRRGAALFIVVLASWSAGVVFAQSHVAPKHGTKANATANSATSTHYEIAGVVLNSVDGSPVPHCHLTPSLNTTERRGFGNRRFFPAPNDSDFYCDAQGHFTVTLPSVGSWQLMAGARGFVSQAYDAHPPYASAIVLTAEAPTKNIEFRISPEASIIGLVLDEAGEPVRNAQITLQRVPRPTPGGPQPLGATRGNARTDDRGMYELPNLLPGEYRLSVHAQPWYAAVGQALRGNNNDASSLDPSLDVAYPTTWFPGVADPVLAETIALHAGDTRQADFHLIPIPSIHMRILLPPPVDTGSNTPPVRAFPVVQQINPGGGPRFMQVTTRFQGQNQIDVGGLTPGVYQIRLAGPNQQGDSSVVEVTANSARTLDMTTPPSDMARITLHFDGLGEPDSDSRPGRNAGVQVELIDSDRRESYFSNGNEGAMLRRREKRDANADRSLEVPPGRYEVVLQGRPNTFLTGLTAKGAETAGRYVTVGASDSTLTIHVASGRASLSGVATLDGEPCVGAMVLLVPVTIEDANSISFLRQDQSNTDGSFEMANVLPGQYILVAIDHGWQINWGDAATLRRYLMQGVPVELKSSAIVKQNVAAQLP
ncbi:MAG: carboxypeptidase-like regulatory domain-containing protein [Edaphobacter sp.]